MRVRAVKPKIGIEGMPIASLISECSSCVAHVNQELMRVTQNFIVYKISINSMPFVSLYFIFFLSIFYTDFEFTFLRFPRIIDQKRQLFCFVLGPNTTDRKKSKQKTIDCVECIKSASEWMMQKMQSFFWSISTHFS